MKRQWNSGISDVPPLIVDGNTVLPLRAMSDALQALVKWDNSNKTAYLYKPNVHMFFTTEVRKDSAIVPFGVVEHGKEADFIVFAQVDNLKTSINSVRVSVVSPSGKSVITPVVEINLGIQRIVLVESTFVWRFL